MLFLIIVSVLGFLFLRAFVFESISIASASMEPTLLVGTHFFSDKLTLRLRDPARGDIIVFTSPITADEEMVKRVIAVGGDTVELKEKKVLLNGKELVEPYVKYTREGEHLQGDNLGPLEVPKGHLFVLGDNRDESNDSASWKDARSGEHIYFVPLSSVKGLVRGAY